MAAKKSSSVRPRSRARSKRSASGRRWSQHVTESSDAMDLEPGVLARRDPASIARSVKRSAERSRRRKADAFRSALSMITFYVNRAGSKLPRRQRERLMQAKDKLRGLFHRPLKNC
ncbi:MAG: DUF3175 domain-containing protein [Nevskia sp.]|nr:DUF3175 domain-containing protein [Nevskia sp.]